MKTTAQIIVGSIFGLSALQAEALVVCNTQQTRAAGLTTAVTFAQDLKYTISKPVEDICIKGFDPTEKHHFASYKSGQLTFTITPAEDNSQLKEGCGMYFEQIIDECIVQKDIWGGSVLADGLLYEMYNHDVTRAGSI